MVPGLLPFFMPAVRSFLASLPTLLLVAVLLFHVFSCALVFPDAMIPSFFSLIHVPPCQKFPTPYPYTPQHLATLPRAIPNMPHLAALAEQAFGPQSAEASLPSFSCCFLLATENETEFEEDSPHIYIHLRRGQVTLVGRQTRHLELALGARSGGQQTIDAFLLHCAARLALRQNKVTSCYTVPEVWSYKYVYTNRSMNDSGRRCLLVHSSVCSMWKSCPSRNVNSIPPVHVTIFLVKHGDTHTCVSEPAMVMSAAIAGQTLEKNGAFKGKLWNCLAHLRRMSFHALKQDAFLRSYLAPSIGDLVNTYESSNDLHLIYHEWSTWSGTTNRSSTDKHTEFCLWENQCVLVQVKISMEANEKMRWKWHWWTDGLMATDAWISWVRAQCTKARQSSTLAEAESWITGVCCIHLANKSTKKWPVMFYQRVKEPSHRDKIHAQDAQGPVLSAQIL